MDIKPVDCNNQEVEVGSSVIFRDVNGSIKHGTVVNIIKHIPDFICVIETITQGNSSLTLFRESQIIALEGTELNDEIKFSPKDRFGNRLTKGSPVLFVSGSSIVEGIIKKLTSNNSVDVSFNNNTISLQSADVVSEMFITKEKK